MYEFKFFWKNDDNILLIQDDFIGRLNEIMLHLEAPLSADLITAQGVIFFVAGFETTASTLSTLSYNLAKHPEIQVHFKVVYALSTRDISAHNIL